MYVSTIRHDTISVKDWIRGLPFDCRQSLSRIEIASIPQDCNALCAAISSHLQEVHEALVCNEFIDISEAEEAARLAKDIAQQIDDFIGEKREIALLAIAFFISSDDAENDLNSPLGFNDDILVLRAACNCLGL
jgi:hypothetical protein